VQGAHCVRKVRLSWPRQETGMGAAGSDEGWLARRQDRDGQRTPMAGSAEHACSPPRTSGDANECTHGGITCKQSLSCTERVPGSLVRCGLAVGHIWTDAHFVFCPLWLLDDGRYRLLAASSRLETS
jgi:hypothetical protein